MLGRVRMKGRKEGRKEGRANIGKENHMKEMEEGYYYEGRGNK